jgi:hypothetical protein
VREVEPLVPETHEAEFASLEDADAEAHGKEKPSEVIEARDDVELDDESPEDESLDEEAFIEDSEEEHTDVAGILGNGIEKEEET